MKLTVIIPTRDAKPEWLQKAVGSCAFADEIIITRDIGLTDAVNNAVDKAHGEYISILPDDDFYLPEIEDIFTRGYDRGGDVIHFPCKHYDEEKELPGIYDESCGITLEQNLVQNKIFGSCFIRRDAFQFLGGYSYDLTVCHDWDLWNKALKRGYRFEYIPVPGAVFRWNSHSAMQKRRHEDIRPKILKSIEAWGYPQ